MKDMNELIEHTLKDTYSAEKQITKALPKMAKAAKNPELKRMFEQHLEQTNEQIKRLDEVAKILGFKPTGVVCKGMEGLIAEGEEAIEEFGGNEVGDTALILAAQKVEHYEIGTYGTMITWAKQMGRQDIVDILKPTINEEEQTDKMLSEAAIGGLNQAAMQVQEGGDKKSASKSSSSKSTSKSSAKPKASMR
jgi:ferritin-like metal-binding protein YciE